MVEKLKKYMTTKEVEDKVHEIMDYVINYGWEERTIHPYNYPIKVIDLLKNVEFYEDYTAASKRLFIAEVNGFIDILNKWIEQENEPKVTIRFLVGNKKGQTKEVPASIAADYTECEFAEIVEGE